MFGRLFGKKAEISPVADSDVKDLRRSLVTYAEHLGFDDSRYAIIGYFQNTLLAEISKKILPSALQGNAEGEPFNDQDKAIYKDALDTYFRLIKFASNGKDDIVQICNEKLEELHGEDFDLTDDWLRASIDSALDQFVSEHIMFGVNFGRALLSNFNKLDQGELNPQGFIDAFADTFNVKVAAPEAGAGASDPDSDSPEPPDGGRSPGGQ